MKHELDFGEVAEKMSPLTSDELRRYRNDSRNTLQARKDRKTAAAAKRNRAIPETLTSIAAVTGLIASAALYA